MAINVSTSAIDISLILTAVNNAAAPLRQLAGQVQNIGFEAKAAQQQLKAIQVVLAGIAFNKGLELSKAFVDTAANVQQLRLRLALAIGDVEKASDLIEEFDNNFTKAGVDANKLVVAMSKFAEIGMPADDAKKLAETLGTLAMTGQDLDGIIDGVSDAFVKLSIRGGEGISKIIDSLGTKVPAALNMIAAGFNMTIVEFNQAVKAGAISSDKILDALSKGVEQRYQGLRQAQERSIRGSLVYLQNAWEDAIRGLGRRTSLETLIAERLVLVRQKIDELVSKLGTNEINTFFNALDSIAGAGFRVGEALLPVIELVGKFGAYIADFIGKLPPEVLTAGLVGYLLAGRLGAVAFGTLAAQAAKVVDDTETKGKTFAGYVETAFPLGLIGLMMFGPKGAIAAAVIGGATDKLITDSLVALEKKAARGDKTFQYTVAGGGTAFSEIGRQVAELIGMGEKASTKINHAFTDLSKGAVQSTTLLKLGLSQASADFEVAEQKVLDFKKALSQETGQDLTKTMSATDAYLKGYDALYAKLGEGIKQIANDANTLDANMDKAQQRVGSFNTMLTEVARNSKNLTAGIGGLDKSAESEAALDRLRLRLTEFNAELAKRKALIEGDTLGQKTAEIDKNYAQIQSRLLGVNAELDNMMQKNSQNKEMVQKIKDLKEQINNAAREGGSLQTQEVQRETELFSIRERMLVKEQESLRLRAASAELTLKQQHSTNALYQLLAGTGAGAAIQQAEQQRMQAAQAIVGYEQQILQLMIQRQNVSGAIRAEIDKTIESYKGLIGKTKEAMNSMTGASVIQQQFWKSVGQTIETGLVDALTAVITKTRSLKDVGVQVFNALTQAAARYIVQLMIMKTFGGFMGGGGGAAGGGGLLGGLFGGMFANGGVFPGGVKMFANGGIVSGPTLFGMAGEKGTEAIMPLERIGGKLGVRATGNSGGDTYHVHVHAIDTQTGAQFLLKNLDTIANGLQHRTKLNRGARLLP